MKNGPLSSTKELISDAARRDCFAGRLAPEGTLLMSFKLSIGKLAITRIAAAHNEAIVGIYPHPDLANRDYLFYCLQHVDLVNDQDTYLKGKTLNKAKLAALPIPLPSLEEQGRISRILSTVQRAGQEQGNVLRHATELRASLRERLFGGLAKTTTLGACAQIGSGGTPSRADPAYWCGDIPWVTTAEIDYSVIQDTNECITARGLAESSTRLFPPGTILIAMYGNGVTRGRVARLGITAAVNQACAAVTAKDGVDPRYLYQHLAFRYEDLRNLGHGAHQKNLSATLLKQFPVALPTLAEQETIARMLDTADRLVEAEARVNDAIAHSLASTLTHLFSTRL